MVCEPLENALPPKPKRPTTTSLLSRFKSELQHLQLLRSAVPLLDQLAGCVVERCATGGETVALLEDVEQLAPHGDCRRWLVWFAMREVGKQKAPSRLGLRAWVTVDCRGGALVRPVHLADLVR